MLEHSLGADTLPCFMESSGSTVLWKWRAVLPVLARAPGSRLFSEETRYLKGPWFEVPLSLSVGHLILAAWHAIYSRCLAYSK